MSILVAAPHPDDETIGCGGTLLKARAAGVPVHWLIFTEMDKALGYSGARIAARDKEIEAIAAHYGFASVHRLGHKTAALEQVPLGEMIGEIAGLIKELQPETLYLPFPGDAHSDHKVAFDAVMACSKWFRAASIKRILCYEALSETDISPKPGGPQFLANVYEDVAAQMDGKIAAMTIFEGETGAPPFPRSEEVIRAKALVRGAEAGFMAAEAFMLVKEIRP